MNQSNQNQIHVAERAEAEAEERKRCARAVYERVAIGSDLRLLLIGRQRGASIVSQSLIVVITLVEAALFANIYYLFRRTLQCQ